MSISKFWLHRVCGLCSIGYTRGYTNLSLLVVVTSQYLPTLYVPICFLKCVFLSRLSHYSWFFTHRLVILNYIGLNIFCIGFFYPRLKVFFDQRVTILGVSMGCIIVLFFLSTLHSNCDFSHLISLNSRCYITINIITMSAYQWNHLKNHIIHGIYIYLNGYVGIIK